MNTRVPAIIVLWGLVCCGCARQPELPARYGRATGDALRSVNGTSVLAEMFRQAGKRVQVSRRLGGLVAQADVVVWAPDTYELPDNKVTQYFDLWLAERPNRLLVYIVKDYDGQLDYWSQVARHDPRRLEYQRRLAKAQAAADRVAARLPAEDSCDWFRVQRTTEARHQPITGPWARMMGNRPRQLSSQASLLPVHLDDTQTAAEDGLASESLLPLLQADDLVLAAEYHRSYWGGGRVLLMASGSWLFNLPLVKDKHRRLANQLVAECASARRVVFLESGETGLRISQGKHRHHALEAFTIRPFNSILLHLTVLGMVFCFAMFPIFGRANPLEETIRSDFRRHVEALGELIAKTGDVTFARQRRDYYWRQVRRDSGKSHMQEIVAETELPTAPVADTATSATPPAAEPGNPFAPIPSKPDTATDDRPS